MNSETSFLIVNALLDLGIAACAIGGILIILWSISQEIQS